MYVCTCVPMYARLYVCTYACTYVCMYVITCVCMNVRTNREEIFGIFFRFKSHGTGRNDSDSEASNACGVNTVKPSGDSEKEKERKDERKSENERK